MLRKSTNTGVIAQGFGSTTATPLGQDQSATYGDSDRAGSQWAMKSLRADVWRVTASRAWSTRVWGTYVAHRPRRLLISLGVALKRLDAVEQEEESANDCGTSRELKDQVLAQHVRRSGECVPREKEGEAGLLQPEEMDVAGVQSYGVHEEKRSKGHTTGCLDSR